MTITLAPDPNPRLLMTSEGVHRQGKDLERFLNLWRLALVGSVAGTMLLGRIGRTRVLPEEGLAEIVLAAMLLFGLALQLYLAWFRWDHRIALSVVLVDILAVTGFLLGCVAVNRAIVATNSQLFFFFYFFVIVSAGLRGDAVVSRTVAWSVPISYCFVVTMAVAWRFVQVETQPDPTYGTFRWDFQLARVAILVVVTLITSYDVGLVASDRAEARTDPLTGVHNRRFLEEFLNREIARCRRSHHPLSVLLLDLDGFKAYNDEHGHLAGDRVLAAVASSLRKAVRATDVVARYGGDEFVVVLPNTLGEAARRVARELCRAVPPPVSVSVGIGCMGEDVHTPGQLVAVADAALMRAKQEGGGVNLE
jgi:diguanylate cyclase (GGDEF)-like protein